jgi:hypothetical protein
MKRFRGVHERVDYKTEKENKSVGIIFISLETAGLSISVAIPNWKGQTFC